MGGNLSKDPLLYIGSISSYSLCSILMCGIFTFLMFKVFAESANKSVGSIAPAVEGISYSPSAQGLAEGITKIPFIPV